MDKVFDWLFQKKKRFFLLLILAAFCLRAASLIYPFLDSDESIFAVIARQLSDGGRLYADGLDNKPPFIFLFYRLCFALFGPSMWGVHLATIALSIFEAILLFKIASENSDERTGYFAALFYTVFSTTFLPKFIATSINAIMVVPLTLACLYWLRGEKRMNLKDDFRAGLFTGIAFLFKFQGGIQLALFLFSLLPFLKERKEETSVSAIRFGACLGGFLVPAALTLLWLALSGILSDFVDWTLLGSFTYIRAGVETISFWPNLLFRGGGFVLSSLLLWVLAFLSVREERNPFKIFLLLWFALSLIPVSMGGRFYGHYFIQLLPPLCLLAGMKASQIRHSPALKWVGMGLAVPALIFWIIRSDFKRIDELFPDDHLFIQQNIGEWLKGNADPGKTLFVWGNAPAIYYFSDLKPASRFIFSEYLTGKIQGSDKSGQAYPKAWDLLWADFSKPPDYLVDTSPAGIHGYAKFPVGNYPEMFRYIQAHYVFWKNIYGCPVYKIRKARTITPPN
ncbi:MAG: glycosyltransferase family 39 protein [Deltaproteobacteria bacterium]|nr:glycosyltransferase family 39 protein [Deltaproteobacteria bacterium]